MNKRRAFAITCLVTAGVIAPAAQGSTPDLTIGSKEYPHADAVILRWEQHWTMARDGAVTRRDHQWVKLLARRPVRRFGDRTIDFRDGDDQLVVHAANTHLPDGRVLPVPDYGFNIGATQAVVGWPAFGGWKERIVSFSGIEPGVTLELDYEITTRAGVWPWVSGDIRLDAVDPVHERVVTITVPSGVALHTSLDNLAENAARTESRDAPDGGKTHSFRFGPFAGVRDEAQAPPWRQCRPRLVWSTADSAVRWADSWLHAVAEAAVADPRIEEFAKESTKDESQPRAQLAALADTLSARFNFLTAPEARRARSCRPAAEVLATHYGNPLESAAVCLAAVRALGMSAFAAVTVDADAWSADVPADAAFAGVIVIVQTDEGRLMLHPEHGVIENPGSWGRRIVLLPDDAHGIQESYIAARGERAESLVQVGGRIEVAEDGSASGDLRVRLTGAFFDPEAAQSSEAQEELVSQILGGVIEDVAVASYTIEALSADELRVSVAVKFESALPEVGGRRVLRLGDGPLHHSALSLPLDNRDRQSSVLLPGPIREQIDLTVSLPESWQARAWPRGDRLIDESWAALEQHVTVEGREVRIRRHLRLAKPRLTAGEFNQLRDALLRLRGDAARTILIAS